MTAKLLLLAAALLVANPAAPASGQRKAETETPSKPVTVRGFEHDAPPVPAPQQPEKDQTHVEKKSKQHPSEEDGKHSHLGAGRFTRRRQRLARLLCRLALGAAYFACFAYCFQHATHLPLADVMALCSKGLCSIGSVLKHLLPLCPLSCYILAR